MNYKKINLYLGWFVFLIATIVYFITIEDTVSLWDCGEYITAAYKLEVGHPPGAPLFMVLGRLFSFFADPENVAVWINRLSALSSSLTILFMFWSLTILIKKMVLKRTAELSKGDQIAIFGGAAIGALAYAFTESFWFSAVEGEVYAMSSLFTAAIFWAALKWDEEMMEIQTGRLVVKGFSPDRWLLLIMFLLGLAIGVHLLGILVVPAISFVIYFRYSRKVDIKGILGVGVLSVVILGFIQEGVIPGSISMASTFEVAFVNDFGLPFYSGTIFFFTILVAGCVFLLRYARKKGRRILYSSVMGLTLLLIGYGSFAVIVIRSNANPPLDENDPENLVTLHSYLKREQYGSAPLLFGQYWNSEQNPRGEWGDNSPFHLRRFVVVKGDKDIKAYKDEARAQEYANDVPGSEVVEKYFMSNASIRENADPTYAQTTFFPRMYWSQEPHKVNGYKDWSGYDPTEDKGTEIGSDKQRLPTFGENMRYFFRYQVNFMYWRYFMWNFAGRQNDIQGHGSAMRGNWKSGFDIVDDARLGSQDDSPYFTTENPSNNSFYFLPIILGLIGLVFHFYRAPKDAFVILLAFLFTGLAIVVYLNQKPFEPRERDYAYAASFYFFAMWIGIGVYALYEAFRGFGKKEFMRIGILFGAGLLIFLVADSTSDAGMSGTISWVIIAGIGTLAIAVMTGLKKVLKSEAQGATVAVLLSLSVPMILGVQGWDDHDRSLKTSAHDLASNYLNSCSKNGIIFTNGDNDTFPLWYLQEVEGKRTDVRVCNLSLMQTDWYTEQMKMRAYESDPLPIKFTEEQILMYAGSTDQVLFRDLFMLTADPNITVSPETMKKIVELRAKANPAQMQGAVQALSAKSMNILNGVSGKTAQVTARLNQIRQILSKTELGTDQKKMVDAVYEKFRVCIEVLVAAQGGQVTLTQEKSEQMQQALLDFEKTWNYTNLKDAMEFVRNDKYMISYGGTPLRIFPSSGFILPVNIENAVKSGIITEKEKDKCHKDLRFNFTDPGLTREQVMMLDVMANNDWKRGLYFSSPGGSDVSLALYRRGYVKQNGMAFEVSPLNAPQDRFHMEVMYQNMMKNYSYGEMKNPDVLTDYYTRRHTTQYRQHFLDLAEDYLRKAMQGEEDFKRKKMMEGVDPEAAARFKTSLTEKQIKDYKQRAINLVNRSLEVMPAEVVIDYGEPQDNRVPDENYELNGRTIRAYKDGNLHSYVGVLYMAGDKKGAEKLGLTVADQLESIIDYYGKSGVNITATRKNMKDFYAAMDAYFRLHVASIDKDFGNKKGDLAKRTGKKLEDIYKNLLPSMMDRLEVAANDNGESTRRGSNAGYYATGMFEIQDYTEAMGIHYGMFQAEQPAINPEVDSTRNPTPEELEQMMQMMQQQNGGGQPAIGPQQ